MRRSKIDLEKQITVISIFLVTVTVLDVEVDANKLSKDMNATRIIAGQVKYPCFLYNDIISPENIKVAGILSRALPEDEYWDEFDFCMEYYLRPFFETAYETNYGTSPKPYESNLVIDPGLSDQDFLDILNDHITM